MEFIGNKNGQGARIADKLCEKAPSTIDHLFIATRRDGVCRLAIDVYGSQEIADGVILILPLTLVSPDELTMDGLEKEIDELNFADDDDAIHYLLTREWAVMVDCTAKEFGRLCSHHNN